MKQRLVSHLALGLSLLALPFLGGCTQNKAGNPNPLVSSANAEPVTLENDAAALAAATTNVQPASVGVVATPATEAGTPPVPAGAPAPVEPAPVAELKPPANVHLSPVLAEAVKLVQAGVDRAVLLTFITNTTGYFTLGADEIVYLNDLGVEGDIITTMMQHDTALRDLRMSAWQSAEPAAVAAPVKPEEEAVATAPSYLEAPAMEAEPVYVSNNYFYDTLSPYGSWVYVTGYGRCWRPTVAVSNPYWRPYGDRGQWVYSDSGWYWLSDYTWGATTFHYGRWFNDARWGWCWWPDTVWAPSWVSWRYTADYCGWAPLPPTAGYYSGIGLTYMNGSVSMSFGFGLGASAYAFVPWGNFCAPQPYRYCAPTSRAAHIYNHSTPVNHFENGGNGRVNNRGIAPDRVREFSRTEVRTVSLRDQAGRTARAERIDRDGRTLAVHRPRFTGTSTAGNDPAAESSRRGSGRPGSVPANELVGSNPPPPPASTPAPTVTRNEIRPGREQGNVNPGVSRPTAPLTPVNGSLTVDARPPATNPTREETRTGRGQLAELETVNRTRVMPSVVNRPARPLLATPMPNVTQPNPVTVPPQTTPRPAAPAQNNSVVVIGRGNNPRPTGRDYSVWSTPSREVPTSRPTRSEVSTSQPSANPPMAVPGTTRAENHRPARSEFGRPQNRNSYSTPSTPQPSPVVTPATRSSPAPINNSRPAPSSPPPGFTPRPQPAPAPTVSRVEARPAPTPASPASVPATTRTAPSRNPGRPAR